MEPLRNFQLDLSGKLQSFIDGHLKNDTVKFLMNHIQMVEKGRKSVLLHNLKIGNYFLEFCEKLTVDYHFTDRTKYKRVIMQYFVASQYDL